jgi:hypothetical protein
MRRTFLVILFSSILASAHAQECSQLLSQGVYDIQASASDLTTASSFSSWFCDQKFSSSQQADSFGASLGLPFKGVPIKLGFNSSSQRWSEWYSNFCSRVQHDQSLQSRVRDHVQTINPQIIQAFNACIEADGLHVWLERTYDPKTFKFAARFNPPTPRNPVATIQTFDPGLNVSCVNQPTTISRAVWRTRCTRRNDAPVTFVVTSDWNPRGGGNLTLPAVARFETPPPPPVIEVVATDYRNGLSQNIAPTNAPGNPGWAYGLGVGNGGPPWNVDRYNRAVYLVNAPQAGPYRIEIRYAAAESRPVQVQVRGPNGGENQVYPNKLAATTGGWCLDVVPDSPVPECRVKDYLRWGDAGVVNLRAGTNEIWIERGAALPHLQALRLTYVGK